MASIQESLFQVHEVNMGYFGIKVMNPSASTEFSNNNIRTLHTHAAAHIGLQIGESESNAARIHSNTIAVRTSTDSTRGEAALQVWGDFNTLDLFAFNSGPGLRFGAKFEPGSNNNTLSYGTIQAETSIVNHGTENVLIANAGGAGLFQIASAPHTSWQSENTLRSSSGLSGSSQYALEHAEDLLIFETAGSTQATDFSSPPAQGTHGYEDLARDAVFSMFRSNGLKTTVALELVDGIDAP
jgi:hypothetical protein